MVLGRQGEGEKYEEMAREARRIYAGLDYSIGDRQLMLGDFDQFVQVWGR
jgi:hypothetical protein